MTDGPTLPSVPCTQTDRQTDRQMSRTLPICLHTRSRPSVWCNLNLNSSANKQCLQRMSQTRWRLGYWRWCRWCTKVSLGHRVGLRELYRAVRRCRMMVSTDRQCPLRRISCQLYLGLERNLLVHIIPSKYRSSWGVEILWRWPIGLRFGGPVYHTGVKIMLMAPYVTPVIRTISTRRHPSQENLTMTCNKYYGIWRGIVLIRRSFLPMELDWI